MCVWLFFFFGLCLWSVILTFTSINKSFKNSSDRISLIWLKRNFSGQAWSSLYPDKWRKPDARKDTTYFSIYGYLSQESSLASCLLKREWDHDFRMPFGKALSVGSVTKQALPGAGPRVISAAPMKSSGVTWEFPLRWGYHCQDGTYVGHEQ